MLASARPLLQVRHLSHPQGYWFKPKEVPRDTLASAVKPGSVLRQVDQLWEIVGPILQISVPGADVERASAAKVSFVLSFTERNVATGATRPSRYLPTDIVQYYPIVQRQAAITAIHRFPPEFPGGKEKIKLWSWLDTPFYDGRSEVMLDAERSGLLEKVRSGELEVGSKVYVNYCDDTPMYLTHPVRPSKPIVDPNWKPVELDKSKFKIFRRIQSASI